MSKTKRIQTVIDEDVLNELYGLIHYMGTENISQTIRKLIKEKHKEMTERGYLYDNKEN